MDTTEYLDFAIGLAKQAGEIMRKYYGKQPDQELKEDNTIVTIADKEINSLVISEVNKKYPGHSIDGEEESYKQDSEYVWVCDPIDGTNPFAMELPVSVFSLALVVNGVPKIGVIYDPNGEKMYSAAIGKGAFVNGDPIKVSDMQLDGKARVNFDWWPEAEYDILTPLVKMSKEKYVYLLSPGSTTHMAALVARGEFLASVFAGTKGKNVDIAAAKVIVEESGGKVTDLFGNEQRYDQDIKGAVVSNGIVHDEIINYLTEGLKK